MLAVAVQAEAGGSGGKIKEGAGPTEKIDGLIYICLLSEYSSEYLP